MNDTQEIIAKIRKLLRLGHGTNHVAEAQSAIAKAHELAAQAGINIDTISEQDPIRVTHEAVGLRRVSYERKAVHGVLITHFGVKMVYDKGHEVVYIGPEVNIALAKYIEEYLIRAVAAAWKVYDRERPQGWSKFENRGTKRSFVLGFFDSIHKTLENRPIRNDMNTLKRAIETYTMALYPKLITRRHKCSLSDTNAAMRGKEAGATVSLNRPVNEGFKTQQLTGSMA